jgi:predicted PurR-regulated permease PerM
MPDRARLWSAALWIIAIIATLFFLRAAKTLMIPIAVAVLLSYAFEPVVAWLERYRVPRLAGTSLVLLLVLGASAGGAYTLRDDAMKLLETLPKAAHQARELVSSQLGIKPEVLTEATKGLGPTSGDRSGGTDAADLPSQQAAGSLVQAAVSSVFSLAWHVVVVFFLIGFLLASGRQVRNRLVEIAGSDADRRHLTAKIIDDINAQIQRYLLVLLFTGAIVAVATWLVLAWMGVQHALMWGVLAGIFNAIPYFGPVIVCGGLFVVGLMQDGGLTQALEMSGAVLLITSLEGWLLTPPLMGKAERMNSLVVFLGLLLWIWLWDEWGTILAVPILVIVKSVADHVDRLKPLGRLMAR